MAQRADLSEVKDRVERWLTDGYFPFWKERAWSDEGLFFEALDLSGNGLIGQPSRVRVQARQLFCFSLAARLPVATDDAREMVMRGIEVLTRDCRRDDGLYGALIAPGVGLIDPTAQLYDNAFVLLAFAKAYSEFGIEEAKREGQALNAAIEMLLKRDLDEGGYAEQLPALLRREQNPHMHLCEASLAWFEATGDRATLARAEQVADFVSSRFFDPDLQLLIEFQSDPGGDERQNHVEIGHLYEWVWIYERLANLTGTDLKPEALNYFKAAEKLSENLRYLPLSQAIDGQPIDTRQRTWILTEQLKALSALTRRQLLPDAAPRIADVVHRLFADHQLEDRKGGWLDELDQVGHPATDRMTAATGYHIVMALVDLLDVLKTMGRREE